MKIFIDEKYNKYSVNLSTVTLQWALNDQMDVTPLVSQHTQYLNCPRICTVRLHTVTGYKTYWKRHEKMAACGNRGDTYISSCSVTSELLSTLTNIILGCTGNSWVLDYALAPSVSARSAWGERAVRRTGTAARGPSVRPKRLGRIRKVWHCTRDIRTSHTYSDRRHSRTRHTYKTRAVRNHDGNWILVVQNRRPDRHPARSPVWPSVCLAGNNLYRCSRCQAASPPWPYMAWTRGFGQDGSRGPVLAESEKPENLFSRKQKYNFPALFSYSNQN